MVECIRRSEKESHLRYQSRVTRDVLRRVWTVWNCYGPLTNNFRLANQLIDLSTYRGNWPTVQPVGQRGLVGEWIAPVGQQIKTSDLFINFNLPVRWPTTWPVDQVWKTSKNYNIPNFVLFYPTSYFLSFHLTSCHFPVLAVVVLRVLFTNVVVFNSLRSSTLPPVPSHASLFPTPNWCPSSLSSSSLKSFLLPLRCGSCAILDF